MQAEIQKLDNEVNEMRLKNEDEKLIIQDLEVALTKRRRRTEKCRRLAEAQSSYRTMLEKMIRDTMHQSVIYKEQVRLNQAASNALTARLEAQRAICDAAEKELYRKYKQRDELEKQIRPEWDQGRKRSRIDYSTSEEGDNKPVLCLPGIRPRTPIHKELRVFLEEEQKASEAGLSANEEQNQEEKEEKREKLKAPTHNIIEEKPVEPNRSPAAFEDENSIQQKLQHLEISGGKKNCGISFADFDEAENGEDEESRKQRGKGNVEKWLQMLLENSQEDTDQQETNHNETGGTEEIIKQLNQKYPQKISRSFDAEDKEKQPQLLKDKKDWQEKENTIKNKVGESFMQSRDKSYTKEACIGDGNRSSNFAVMGKGEQQRKEKLVRSESARTLRRIPSSPSLLGGVKKGVDCIRKKWG